MKTEFRIVCASRAIVGIVAASLATIVPASTIWQHDWEATGSLVSLWPQPEVGLLRTLPNGEVVFFQSRGSHAATQRLSADGSLRWQAATSYSASSGIVDGIAFDDGSAAQLQQGTYLSYITRFDANGQPLWGSPVPASRFAAAATAVVAIGVRRGAVIASAVDASSGATRWQRLLSDTAARFPAVAVAGAKGGESYVAYQTGTNDHYTLARLNAVGVTEWSVAAGSISALAVNGAQVFALSATMIQAFRASDGVLQWQAQCNNKQIYFVDSDPVCVIGGTEVRRLAAASGAPVWSQPASGGELLGVFESDVYYAYRQQWTRWRGVDGALQWQVPIARIDPAYTIAWPSASGVVTLLDGSYEADDHSLRRYRSADGELIASIPPPEVPTGIFASGVVQDGADLFLRGFATGAEPAERLRRIAIDSGAPMWETSATRGGETAAMAAGPNTLFIADSSEGSSVLRSVDRATGVERWRRTLDYYGSESFVSRQPRLDVMAGGDVIAYSAWVGPPELPLGERRERQRAWRFASTDGAEQWQYLLVDRARVDPRFLEPPLTTRVGDDIVLTPEETGFPAHNLQRLGGTTGEPVWVSPDVAPASAVAAAIGEDAFFSLSDDQLNVVRVTKRRASTGEVLWELPLPQPPNWWFRTARLLALADGDVILAGNAETGSGVSTLSAPRVLRIRADGSGLRYAWGGGADPAMLVDVLVDFAVDADSGRAWFYRLQGDRYVGAAFLMRFDLEQGFPTGGQFYRASYLTPLTGNSAWDYVLRPYRDEQMIDAGVAERAPLPSTFRVALRDYAVQRRGDLRVQIDNLPTSFAPGEQVPLGVSVHYDGDAPVTGATLIVDPPWHGTHSALACSGVGQTQCTIDTHTGKIVLRFDALPGAHLRLTGNLRALEWPGAADATPRAVVFAPEGLLESDTRNNFHAAGAIERIFRDGFSVP